MEIPLCRPCFDTEELQEVKKVLESGWVSKGPEAEMFEQSVMKYVGVDHAIAVVNCTAALHLALLALGIKKGDEVLVADFTFPATGHSVVYCGAKPVFVDVLPDTYNINIANIEPLINERTKAIIPVHTFGQPAEMDRLMKIAKENGLSVVEDCACSLGATFKGRQTGGIGDIGCFSFHARKGISTGEGGMVVTNNNDLANSARFLSVFGMRPAWERENESEYTVPQFFDIGYNYKLSDILAAVGVVQMKKIDSIIKRKRTLAAHYDSRLEDGGFLMKPHVAKGAVHIYQSYVTLVDPKINRNRLIMKLRKKGIQTQIGTYASHVQPVYRSKQSCPVSKDLSERTLALPFFYSMTHGDIDKVCDVIQSEISDVL